METLIFETYRPLLFSLAYRMTGSAAEAEDIVQDAYLRSRAADTAAVRSPKAFLCTIVTHLSLDYLKSARATRERYIGTWLPEPLLTSDGMLPLETVEQRETISLAFLALLEYLTPQERAVFLLRDIFAYDYAEIAETLGLSEANCRQILHRARERIAERRPRFEPSAEEQRRLTERFLAAVQAGELEPLTELLAADVTVHGDGGGKVPVAGHPLVGPLTVARFLLGLWRKAPAGTRISLAEVNGAPAMLIWIGETLNAVFELEMSDRKIAGLYNVLNPDKLTYITRQLRSTV